MSRTSVWAAVLFAAWNAHPAVAQPMPGQPLQFRPFNGVNPEQFRQSSAGRAADQVILELSEFKSEVAGSRLGFAPKAALTNRADVALSAATSLRQMARQGRTRQELSVAYTELERTVSGLVTTVNQYPQAGPAVTENLSRVTAATQNLGAILVSGDDNPAQRNKWVIRLVETLDDQTEGLRDMLGDAAPPGYDRNTDLTLRVFTRAVRNTGRTIRDTGNLDRARADYPNVLTTGWANVGNQLARIPNLPPEVRNQAIRVDGTFRRLGEVLNGGVNPNPGPPVPPLPGPTPRGAVVGVGAGEGGGPRVRVFHGFQSRAAADFFAYDADFRGGVRVSVADLNGDDVPDLVTAPGPGMRPLVRVFDGRDQSLLVEFLGLDPNWQGGVNVAAADLGSNGRALVAVAPDVGGGPLVKVFDLAQGKEIDSFFAFPENLRGGCRLAWGDVNGDGIADLVAAPGPCDHPPEVKVFNGKDRKVLAQFIGLDPRWRGGLWVAAADVTRNGRAEVVVGADAGGTPLVRVFDPAVGKLGAEWLAFPEGFRGGVRVACRDFDGDGRSEVICAPGPGMRNVPVRVFGGRNNKPTTELAAFPMFEGGGFVGGR